MVSSASFTQVIKSVSRHSLHQYDSRTSSSASPMLSSEIPWKICKCLGFGDSMALEEAHAEFELESVLKPSR